jgi:hypothetical protein
MWAEMYGKGGRLCQEAKSGTIRCPLHVRPTSEDVITGAIFQVLSVIDPSLWLPELLNQGLGAKIYRKKVLRRFRIELWKNCPPYPRRLLPWDEGSTQVDVTLNWENPPTTIFIEMKYTSGLGTTTSNNSGEHGYPSDQLIRNVRVGLLECGWFRNTELIETNPRDFHVIVLSPRIGSREVQAYRTEQSIRASIPHSHLLSTYLPLPIVGEIEYGQLAQVLRQSRKFMSRAEQLLSQHLIDFLHFKAAQFREASTQRPRQRNFAINDPQIQEEEISK